MKCPNCENPHAYQGFLFSPECPNKNCVYFSQRRLDEIAKDNPLANYRLISREQLEPLDTVKIYWGNTPQKEKFNGLYKVIKVFRDELNILVSIEAEPKFSINGAAISTYIFRREDIVQAFREYI